MRVDCSCCGLWVSMLEWPWCIDRGMRAGMWTLPPFGCKARSTLAASGLPTQVSAASQAFLVHVRSRKQCTEAMWQVEKSLCHPVDNVCEAHHRCSQRRSWVPQRKPHWSWTNVAEARRSARLVSQAVLYCEKLFDPRVGSVIPHAKDVSTWAPRPHRESRTAGTR